MTTARRSSDTKTAPALRGGASLLAAVFALSALLALIACSKGSSSIDQDQNKAAGLPLGQDEDLCGNGKIDEDQDEECDGQKLGRATCQSLGFSAGGVLACDPETCIYDTSMCKLPPMTTPTGGSGG
jgi:hypothetical protein